MNERRRDLDPQTRKLWNEQMRAQMAYQMRVAKLLREESEAARRAKAAFGLGAPAAQLPPGRK